jgi:hypothetical protein
MRYGGLSLVAIQLLAVCSRALTVLSDVALRARIQSKMDAINLSFKFYILYIHKLFPHLYQLLY